MGVFSELKRRNVLRMAALYIVAAWLVVQVAGALIDLTVLPEEVGPWVMTVLVIGFPIALVASWFFEVTPEGLSLDKDVPEGQPITHATGRRMDFVIIAILSAGLLMFAWDKWWPRGPQELTVAVLAFENMSADPEQEYFSDGISEEILNLLAQIKGLKVIARTSSFSFKDKDVDIATMAQQLSVRHILEGSVRRSGERVRITAQLIDAKDSSHLWSQTFDRDYDAANLFHIQSEIARAITNRLRMTLTGEDEARLAKVPTENTEAYTAYLIGRDRLRDRKVEGLKEAVDQFAKAIELDPQFAGAYSGLADACDLYEGYSGGYRSELCPASQADLEQLARKAVELDPESGEAWVSVGSAITCKDGDFDQCIRGKMAAYERGLELNPSHSQGYHWYGLALRNGNLYPDWPSGWIEAWKAGVWQSVFEKGLEVDPLSISLHYQKAMYPLNTRSKEQAIWHAQRMVEIAPDSPRGYETLGEQAWYLQGRLDEAIRWESRALERDPQHSGFSWNISKAYSELGDPEMALAYLDLTKALVSPDNKSLQNSALVQQAFILFLSGPEDAQRVAELHALPSEQVAFVRWIPIEVGVYLDLTLGQPAHALARIQTLIPECKGAKNTLEEAENCPTVLVRIYHELGDDAAARDLGDAMVRNWKTWSDAYPDNNKRLRYAGALANTGRTDQALDVLEDLISSGWRGSHTYQVLRFMLCCAVSFDAIRDDKRFQAIVATIEADLAQQLENVREMQRRGEVPTLEEVRALIAAKQEGD